MALTAALARALAGVALVAALTACGGAPAASSNPLASAAATPTAVATSSQSASVSPSPYTSAKPRPSIDQAELDAILTSSITVLDLADGDLAVTVGYVDPDSDEPIDLGTYTLGFGGEHTNEVPPGIYQLAFRQPADSATGPTCTIELGDGEAYTFAAIEGAVAIARTGEAPTDAGELFVGTSSLCLD